MKIVILGTAFPFRGGLAAYNERLANELQQQGHEVSIVTFTLQYPSFLFPGSSQYASGPSPAHLKIKEAVNSINPFNWISVGRQIKKEKPDLIIVKFWLPFMSPCFGTICRIAKSNGHTKIVSILDNVIPHEKRPGDFQLIRYFVGAVDGFVAMSDSVKNDLALFTNKTCLLQPHPIYDNFGNMLPKWEAKQHIKLKEDVPYILFFGFIRDYKGLDLLLEALNHPLLRSLPFKAIIAGEFYTASKPYTQMIQNFNLEEKVILRTDFIPDEDVKNYFCAADIVVQPYKTATQSGVTQICYHFNKPMLVTDVGGLSEIVPHNKAGYVVQPHPQEIAEALSDFYNNQREHEMAAFVSQEKQKYSWEAMTKAIFSLCK